MKTENWRKIFLDSLPLWPVNEIDNGFEVNFIVKDWDINWTKKNNKKRINKCKRLFPEGLVRFRSRWFGLETGWFGSPTKHKFDTFYDLVSLMRDKIINF